MKRVLELAECGWGMTNPNPLVGALIVKDGRVVSEGYHEKLGHNHAEVSAFKNAIEDVKGATMYVNLEPCSHYGKTPPCAKAIIEAGIKEVFVGMVDPNPKVAGNGINLLRENGIDVTVGILEKEAKYLNEIFIKYISEKNPFVILKSAMTIDGKINSVTGDSKWISGDASREYVHRVRNRVSAIMVGINTVLNDNPRLTTRINDSIGNNPVRIVVDSKGIIPLDCRVLDIKDGDNVIVATTSKIDKNKEMLLIDKGVIIIKADSQDGRVDLNNLMNEIYKLEIDSVLLEGGSGLNASALMDGIVDKIMMFVAPKILGGDNALTPVGGKGISNVSDAISLKDINVRMFDNDVLIEGYINK